MKEYFNLITGAFIDSNIPESIDAISNIYNIHVSASQAEASIIDSTVTPGL